MSSMTSHLAKGVAKRPTLTSSHAQSFVQAKHEALAGERAGEALSDKYLTHGVSREHSGSPGSCITLYKHGRTRAACIMLKQNAAATTARRLSMRFRHDSDRSDRADRAQRS